MPGIGVHAPTPVTRASWPLEQGKQVILSTFVSSLYVLIAHS